jgi:hypothetical protein
VPQPNGVVLYQVHVSRVRQPGEPGTELGQQIDAAAGLGQRGSDLPDEGVKAVSAIRAAGSPLTRSKCRRFHGRTILQAGCQFFRSV